jgi:hypothetical protein
MHELENELARRSLLDFTIATKENYMVNWHHELVCEYLDRFVAGEINRLMINMPPQTGKSELSSRRLPTYIFGKYSELKIATITYNSEFAWEFGRDVKEIMSSERYLEIFPKTRIPSIGKNHEFRIYDDKDKPTYGSYLATGIRGAITGRKVDILIVDDIVKDEIGAKSPMTQYRNWEWWHQVADTRLHNKSKVLFLMTRWDRGDLPGRLLSSTRKGKGSGWTVLVLPSLKEKGGHPDDPREKGEALWPEMHSLERLLEAKAANPGAFNALHQQCPEVASEYKIFNGWIQIKKMPKEDFDKFFGLDWGYTNNPTAVIECMHHKGKGYVKELMYETEMTNPDIVNGKIKKGRFVKGLKALGVGSRPVYCDRASPKDIQELKAMGINAKPSIGGQGSVLTQINYLKSLKMHYVSTKGHVAGGNLDFELDNHQWMPGADGPTNQEIDKYNHLTKAAMYGFYAHLHGSGGGVA